MFQNSGIHQAISASCNAEDQENKQAQNSANKQESTKSSELAVRSALMQLETPPIVCDVCGKLCLNVRSYNRHKLIHKEKKYTCKVCSHKFHQSSNLRRHIRSHTGERPFSCEQCGYRFTQKEHMISHIRTKHNLQPGDLKNKMPHSDTEEILDLRTASSKARDHENRQLNNAGNNRESAESLKLAARPTKLVYGKMFSKASNGRSHKKNYRKKLLACNYSPCSYKTHDRSNLKRHKMTHTGEHPYSCNQCNYRCRQRSKMNLHMRNNHQVQPDDLNETSANSSRNNKENCQSNNAADNQQPLDTPKTAAHGSEEYACTLCCYKTEDPLNLEQHKENHIKEYTYKCDHCNLLFKRLK